MFMDEKLSTIEQKLNAKSERIWVTDSSKATRIVERTQKPLSVMVWTGITATAKTPLIFIQEGVKIDQVVSVIMPFRGSRIRLEIRNGHSNKIRHSHNLRS